MRKPLFVLTLALVLTGCAAPEPATPASLAEKLTTAVDETLDETSVVTVLVNGETFAKGMLDPSKGYALTFVNGPTVLSVDDDTFLNPNSLASSLNLQPGTWVRVSDRSFSPSTSLDPLALLREITKLPVSQSRASCFYLDGARSVLVKQLSRAQRDEYTNTNPVHAEACTSDGRIVRVFFDANNLAVDKTATLAFSFSYDDVKLPATPKTYVDQADVAGLHAGSSSHGSKDHSDGSSKDDASKDDAAKDDASSSHP